MKDGKKSISYAIFYDSLKVVEDKTKEKGLEVLDSTPYLMDLETTNGTFINGEKLEPRRYYQLLQKDCVKFGASTREYVLLAEDAAGAGRR